MAPVANDDVVLDDYSQQFACRLQAAGDGDISRGLTLSADGCQESRSSCDMWSALEIRCSAATGRQEHRF